MKPLRSLRHWRTTHNYTQMQAAKQLHISLRNYQNYEWKTKPLDRTITALIFLHDYEKTSQASSKKKF